MDFKDKVDFLSKKIEETLIPLIDHDYVLWECPYYCNIGDILIWEGELELLKKVKHKCLDIASRYTCDFPTLTPDVIILLQGGGNFGDLWYEAQKFRLKVCEKYPKNKIIIFPQTIFYENSKTLLSDAKIMSEHRNLTICARDMVSYQVLKKYFKNNILLLPDMAFCISVSNLRKYCQMETEKGLFLKRTDKELSASVFELPVDMKIDIHDWPTYEKKFLMNIIFETLLRIKNHFNFNFLNSILNRWAITIYRRDLITIGVKFLSSYSVIYTTRLHVLILGVLLQKKCIIIDNSYGKNSSFFETWLEDLEQVEIISKEDK